VLAELARGATYADIAVESDALEVARNLHLPWAIPRVACQRSDDVDVPQLDRVVAVAEAVPRRDLGLDVAVGIGGAGAQAVSPGVVRVPLERPVLPLVRPGGWFKKIQLVDADRSDRNPRVAVFDINKGNRQIAHAIDRVLRPSDLP